MTGTPAWQTHLLKAWQSRQLLARMLWPMSLLYRSLVALRRGLYHLRLLRTTRLDVPVVVVGNVVAGGSGKTPVVIALVETLQAQGLTVAVLARGYGRQSQACLEVHSDSQAEAVGDEPLLIKQRTAAPVFVASSRVLAAQSALRAYPALDLVVCDDGLQHLALGRDIEIGVFDDRGVGNGWLLPAGPLREPWPRRLDVTVHSGSKPCFSGFQAQRQLSHQAIDRQGRQHDLSELAKRTSSQPWMAVAAIAQPEAFFAMLRAQGLRLSHTLGLPDHASFQDWTASTSQGLQILCTEKDAVKLWRYAPQALAVPLNCSLPETFYQSLTQLLHQRCPGSRAATTLSSRYGHTTT